MAEILIVDDNASEIVLNLAMSVVSEKPSENIEDTWRI